MSLNPSCNSVPKALAFPVLGDPPFSEDSAKIAMAELSVLIPAESLIFDNVTTTREVYKQGTDAWRSARAGIYFPGMAKPEDIETISVTDVRASAYGWKLRRAWYYWVTTGGRLPLATAEEMYASEGGKEVRVDGHCASPPPSDPFITSYHIDTVRGLRLFLATIKEQR